MTVGSEIFTENFSTQQAYKNLTSLEEAGLGPVEEPTVFQVFDDQEAASLKLARLQKELQ